MANRGDGHGGMFDSKMSKYCKAAVGLDVSWGMNQIKGQVLVVVIASREVGNNPDRVLLK